MVRSYLSLTFVLTLTIGCVTTSDPFADIAGGKRLGQTPMDLRVRVKNEHYDPVSVSAVFEDMNYFLGIVRPGVSQTFQIPSYILASHGGPRFHADPEGSAQDLLTQPVNCARARTVEWRIKRNLHASRPRVFSP